MQPDPSSMEEKYCPDMPACKISLTRHSNYLNHGSQGVQAYEVGSGMKR